MKLRDDICDVGNLYLIFRNSVRVLDGGKMLSGVFG